MKRLLFVFALPLLLLVGCGADPVRVGSKDFTENRILAEMMVLVIEAEGISVERHIAAGDSRAVFEALRMDRIDAYPEYSGTALALLGLPVSADSAEARDRATAELSELGIAIGEPFGFESRFAVVMPGTKADAGGIAGISDLAGPDAGLTLAVTDTFARRPQDGLRPFLDRYGLAFGDVVVLDVSDSAGLIDLLIDGAADIAVVVENEATIGDFDLRALADDAGFFPAYEAFPLIASAALETYPELGGALARLSGQLDAAAIGELVAQVNLTGRSPRGVAREYLAARDILPAMPPAIAMPDLLIAIDPADIGTPMANDVLRAARRTVPNRLIRFLPEPTPVSGIFDETARVALVPAVSLFVQASEGGSVDERLETVAAVGSYFVHALARDDGPRNLGEAARIATGPSGSPSHLLAEVIAGSRAPETEIVPLEGTDALLGAGAVADGRADIALVLAPLGRRDIGRALAEDLSLRLVPASAWWGGAIRLTQPYPRPAIIPAGAYAALRSPVETLSMQAVVIGPAPSGPVIGQQGPVSYSDAPLPVTDAVVRTFNDNLGDNPDVNPLLRPASALLTRPDPAMQPLNRSPAYTVLSLFILVFIGWAIWLLTRPTKKGLRHD
jgi:glycine betaine/choline ABC-type transport system substrate-binding protein